LKDGVKHCHRQTGCQPQYPNIRRLNFHGSCDRDISDIWIIATDQRRFTPMILFYADEQAPVYSG
jgi:hypothetical protein